MTMPRLDMLADISSASSPEDIFEQHDGAVDGDESGANAQTVQQQGGYGAGYGQTGPAVDKTKPIPGGGELLEEPDDSKVFKSIDEAVLSQERLAKNRDEEGKHWDRIKRGVQFSILEKSEDQSVYRAVLPPGVEDVQQPIPNKVQDLCNKQVNQILVDPPLPNPKPDGDLEKSQGAMDLAGRFLRADGDASGTNDSELYREVLTLNRTRKAAFVYVWVDPTAGGWRPKQKLAHPQATDPANPLMGPVLDAQGQPVLDPTTGAPLLERTADPVLRYVGEQEDEETGETVEAFVEHAIEAAREWLPKIRRMVLHPNQVRTIPATATAVKAHSIIVLMWEPLCEARCRFPQLATMSTGELRELARWRPRRWKAIVPEAMRPKNEGLDASGAVTDSTLIFWYQKFCRISPDYPDGADIAVTGATLKGGANKTGYVLARDTLREDVEQPDGTVVPVLMQPPIAQCSGAHDVDGGDPQGVAAASMFGGANEIRAHLYLSTLEDIDVRLHPNTFLTATSSLTREDLTRRDDGPLEVLTKDDMPIFEQRPQFPGTVPEMLDRVEHDMDNSANLNQTAQSLDSAYSESGEAKKVAISQAKVQLAQDWQGFINFCLQYWKIKLQLGQARLKVPMLVKIGGENSAYKAKHFIGADMLGVSSVSLMPGSGTMMSPAEKSQYLQAGQAAGWLDKAEAGALFRSSMSDDLGLPPSPHEEHIDRCIADWLDGPPKGWLDQQQANAQIPERQQAYAAQLQQMTALFTARGVAQPVAEQMATARLGPAPQPTPLYTPFEARANDEEPVVAQVQYQKLSKLMSTSEYKAQPKPWRDVVDQKYSTAAYAAGIQTVRQQQQAQADQAQAAAASQQATAKPDPNAPPTWQAFLAGATRAVVANAQSLLARETEALAKATVVAEKAGADPVPAMLGGGAPGAGAAGAAGDATGGAAAGGAAAAEPVPTHPLDLTHDAKESARDRAHQLHMETVKHANKMEQLGAQHSAAVVGKTLDLAARNAARQQGAPTPAPTTGANAPPAPNNGSTTIPE